MSKGPLRVARAIPRIRRDGKDIEITFQSHSREQSAVVVDAAQLSSLIENLFSMHAAARHSEATSRPADPGGATLETPPPVLQVTDLSLVHYAETQGASIRAQTQSGEVILVLLPQHLRFLIECIRRTESLSPPPGTH